MYNTFKTYFRLLSYLKNMWLVFALGILASLLSGFLDGWLGQYVRVFINNDNFVKDHSLWYLPYYIFIYFFIRASIGFISIFCTFKSGNEIMSSLRNDAFVSLMGSKLHHVKDSNTGNFLSLLNYDVSQVDRVITESLRRLVLDVSLIVTAIFTLVNISYSLTLLIVGMGPIMYFSLQAFSGMLRRESENLQTALGSVMRYAEQSVDAISTIRSMSAHYAVLSIFKQKLQYALKHQTRFTYASSMLHASLQFIMSIPLSVAFSLFWWDYIQLSSADLIAFAYTIIRIMPPIRAMSLLVTDFQRGIAAADSVFAVCDLPQVSHKGILDFSFGDIVLSNVSYSIGDKKILECINLSLSQNKMHVFVGFSGVGKSTLLLILAQLIDNIEGDVSIGFKSYKDINLNKFRLNVGFMDQSPFIWDDSILNNIIFPVEKSPDLDLYNEVLKITSLDEWVDTLGDKSNSIIGSGYTIPSGGQKQRISLARILYKRPKVMILDEPTSSVDENTGRNILSYLLKIKQDRLIILSSHQKIFSVAADCVHFITATGIYSGTHENLMENKLYRSYWVASEHENKV